MAYPIPTNAVLEIQIVGQQDLQTTRSVFHYLNGNPTVPVADGKAAAQQSLLMFAAGLYTTLTSQQSTNWACQYLQAQWIAPNRYRAIQILPADAGGPAGGAIAGPCLPAGVCVRINVFGQASGRKYQGGNWFPGIPIASELNSSLSPAAELAWSATVEARRQFMMDTAGNIFSPYLYKKGEVIDYNKIIIGSHLQTTLRYQRRRVVGRGE